MAVLFWIGVAWFAYVWIGYPLVLAALSLVRRVRPTIDDAYEPAVSVLFAARNEEKDIGWKIRQTLNWSYPPDKLQVLVASDASDDGTDDIVRGIDDPRVVFVRMEQRSGKNAALNKLVPLATGDVLFFTDANSEIAPDCVRRMVRHFADERVGCVTGEMHYIKEGRRSAVASGARTYWRYEYLMKQLESAIGSVLVCVGSIFCIRRSLYKPLQPALANDLETPMTIGHAGHWVRYEPTARSVERATTSPREEAMRRLRICGRGFIGMWRLRRMMKGLRGWQFVSRKLMRWLTLIPLLMIFVATIFLSADPFFAALLVAELAFIALAAVGAVLALTRNGGMKLFSIPFYFLLVGASGLYGIVSVLFGKRFETWETSTRPGPTIAAEAAADHSVK